MIFNKLFGGYSEMFSLRFFEISNTDERFALMNLE